MPPRDWRLRVEDMLEAIERVTRYTTGLDFAAFSADERTLDAVVRNLEVLGEAARLIPEDISARAPEVPWTDIRATRNILAHDYFGVDLDVIWKTVPQDLPSLKSSLQELLRP